MKSIMTMIICTLAIAASLLQWPLSKEAAAQQQGVLSVGYVSLHPRKEINKFQPVADYLAGQLGSVGITSGKVFLAATMEEMASHIKQGRVDIYIDSPFPISRVMEIAGAKPFLRRWKKGQAEYHSVVFVRKDSEIDNARKLKGRMIGFEEPFSTSGYFLPKAALVEAGLSLTRYEDASAKVSADKLGFVFTHSDENTMNWVLSKKVAAGAVDDDAFPDLAGKRIDELRIVAKSIDVPRQVVAYRADLDPKILLALEKVMLAMDQDEKGKVVLRDFQKTTKFDRFPGGPEKTFEAIRRIASLSEK